MPNLPEEIALNRQKNANRKTFFNGSKDHKISRDLRRGVQGKFGNLSAADRKLFAKGTSAE